jgi:hypothetical protein
MARTLWCDIWIIERNAKVFKLIVRPDLAPQLVKEHQAHGWKCTEWAYRVRRKKNFTFEVTA